MNYIPKNLKKEIRRKFELVKDPNLLSFFCQRHRMRAIEKNAQIHSFRIEYPNLKVPHNVPKGNGRKFVKEGIKNIKDAFDWGRRNFNPKIFDENFIRELAVRITPEIHLGENAEYRNTGTRITGASVTPPDPYKVKELEMPRFVESVKKQLRNENIINTIGASIYSHLHLVRIHPFEDGNGRTSRILQDIILDHYKIPVPVIEAGERNTYYAVLDKAVYDWKHKKYSGEIKHGATEGENLFYTFMAGKINTSIYKVLKCYHKI